MDGSDIIVQINGLSKSFPGVMALSNVDLSSRIRDFVYLFQWMIYLVTK